MITESLFYGSSIRKTLTQHLYLKKTSYRVQHIFSASALKRIYLPSDCLKGHFFIILNTSTNYINIYTDSGSLTSLATNVGGFFILGNNWFVGRKSPLYKYAS